MVKEFSEAIFSKLYLSNFSFYAITKKHIFFSVLILIELTTRKTLESVKIF